MKFSVLVAFSVISIASCAAPSGRGSYETPQYKSALKDGAFEIREYPSMTVATVPMEAKGSNKNSAFMRLFRYISGKNEKAQKIEMTTPVFSTMTEEREAMSFVVPAKVVESGVPKADDADVVIRKRSGGRFAVYRYSGRWTKALENEARGKLTAWIKERNLTTIGGFEKASYDPPFTLPSRRRNEVMVRIRD